MERVSKHPVCIVGMHRSGTSMVARLLQLCGLDLGPKNMLMGASPSNQGGHFEHREFVDLNQALLERLGGSWDNPPDLKEGWERDPSLYEFTLRARKLITNFAPNARWGWKDPRTTLLLPFWKQLIPNMLYVICVRNPLDVARSLADRDQMSIAGASELWYQYCRKAISETDPKFRIVTFFEDYFENPMREFKKVAEFCGFTERMENAVIQETVLTDLRHQVTSLRELLVEAEIPFEYKLLFLGLRQVLYLQTTGGKHEQQMSDFSDEATVLVQKLETFRHNHPLAQLENELARGKRLLDKSRFTLLEKEQEIANLELANRGLMKFSEAVRNTLAYRFYRNVLKPLTGGREM